MTKMTKTPNLTTLTKPKCHNKLPKPTWLTKLTNLTKLAILTILTILSSLTSLARLRQLLDKLPRPAQATITLPKPARPTLAPAPRPQSSLALLRTHPKTSMTGGGAMIFSKTGYLDILIRI